MDLSDKPQPKALISSARTVAAIDVGSNALRMAIAEVLPTGHIEVLERLQRAVRLGQDTFRRRRLGGETLRAAMAILRDFKQLLDLYHVERVRAVATSAIREASNADTFLDRAFMATGLNFEVIGTSEESRLTVSAVRQSVSGAVGVDHEGALIADVGGGSTLLTLLENGEIVTAQSLRLGSIRMLEMLTNSEDPPERTAELLRHHIANMITGAQGSLPLGEIRSFVAVGGDARFAARQIGKPTASIDLWTVGRAQFDRLVDRCERLTTEELSKRYGLPLAEAETLNPALLVYQRLLDFTGAKQMLVSQASMRDGLLLELASAVTGEEDPAISEGIIHSALALAEKYRVDLNHARQVSELAVRLFDQLQADHGLGRRHRLLLQLAGLLHEIGGYVSSRSHHKHSYYLIANSEIFGLNRTEIEVIAHVARYHRRSGPKPSHVEYLALPREWRVVISKLSAILRVADAISRGQIHNMQDLRFDHQGDELIIYVPGLPDLTLEQRAISIKGDMFEDIYGMRVRLEEA
jgi:exopolyphosphatase/guanosine-5'-triphosphate,3'-diphosphate pyrophosphatase